MLHYEEGYEGKPYLCSEGYPTYGIGHKLSNKKGNLSAYSDLYISLDEAKVLLAKDCEPLHHDLSRVIGKPYTRLTPSRKIVIQSMAFQMGVEGVAKFKNMWKSVEQGDWNMVSAHMLDSKWARQTPQRASRHSTVMKYGSVYFIYGARV